MIYFLNTFWSYYWISHIDSLFTSLYFKECRHAGWSCKDQKDPRNCKNEAILQEIKTPIKFCTSTSSKSYRTICSKPKDQCTTVVGLHAKPLIITGTLQSRTGPAQGQNRVFPVKFFWQGKTCFHYRDFPVRKTSQGKPYFHYREWVCSVGYRCTSTGENFAFLYTGTAQKLYRQVL